MRKSEMGEPNWNPLEKRLGRHRCAGFMYMGRVNGINLYKHGISRSYLNLDDEGNCHAASERGCYLPANFDAELAKLEKCLEQLNATLETPYDESFIAQKHEALRRQGIPLLTFQVEPDDLVIC
jgi:hypothetical protein